jgi:hypothetical protein
MSKYVVMAGWDDVPHLDEQTKKDLYASIPPYQRVPAAHYFHLFALAFDATV